jgi:hypothetical protein
MAVKFFYKRQIGNGTPIKFWEVTWFGSAPLATLYWEVYFVVNQQTHTIYELWDRERLRCNFRRTFTDSMLEQWREFVEIAKSINFL